MLVTQLLAVFYTLLARTSNWLLIRKHSQNSSNAYAFNAVVFIVSLVYASTALLFLPTQNYQPTLKLIFFGILTSGLYVVANSLRFFALRKADVSVVSIITQLSLLSGTLTPVLLGRATMSVPVLIGILLVLMGNIALVFDRKSLATFTIDRYTGAAIIAALFVGWAGVSYDYVKNDVSLLFFTVIMSGIQIIMMSGIKSVNTKSIVKEVEIHGKALLWLGLLWLASGTSVLVAIKVLGIVLGTVIGSLSLVTTVLAGIIFLKERDHVLMKLVSTAIVFTGTLLVALNR